MEKLTHPTFRRNMRIIYVGIAGLMIMSFILIITILNVYGGRNLLEDVLAITWVCLFPLLYAIAHFVGNRTKCPKCKKLLTKKNMSINKETKRFLCDSCNIEWDTYVPVKPV